MPLQGNRTSSNGWVDQAEAIQNLTAQANQAEIEKQRRQAENAYREQWNAAQVSPWVMSQAKKTTQLPVSAAQSDPSGRHVTTNGTDVNRTAAQAGLNTTRLNENLQRQEAYRTAMKESPESYQKVREQYEQKPDLDQRPSYQKNQSASVPGIDPANWAPSYQRAQTPLEQESKAPNLTVKEQREVDRRAKAENLEQQRPALKAAADNLTLLGKEIEEAGRQILDSEAKYNRDPSSENLQAYMAQVLQQQRRVDLYNQMYGTYETSRSQYDTEKSAYDKEYDDAVRYAGMDYDALSQYIKNIQNTRPKDETDQEKMSLEIQRAKAYQLTLATTKQLEAEYARVEALRDAERERFDWSKVDTHDAIRAGELAELDEASSKARLKTLNEELRRLQAALDTAEDNDDRIAYLQYAAGNKGANIPQVREGKTAKALQEIEKTLGAGALNRLLNEGTNPATLITDEKTLDASIARLLPYMDEAEKNAFRTFVASSDWAHAGDFLDTLRPKLEAMAAKADTEAITKYGEKNFGTAAASTFMAGTLGALGAQTAYFDNLYTALNNKLVDAFSLGQYRTSDVNSGAYAAARAAQDFSSAAQAYNAQVGEQTGMKELEQALNQISGASSSALSNIIQMAMFGKYMLPVMSTQAAGMTTTEMLRSGASAEDTAFMSTASGLVEYMTEKLPLEHMLERIGQIADLKKGGMIGLADVMRMVRDQGMEEASEEVIGNIAENLIDIAYNGSDSEFGKFESELRMMGYSNAEARTQAFNKFFVGDSIEAAVSAFISSAMLLGPTAVMQNSQMRKIGNQVLQSGSAIEEAAKALNLPDSEDYAEGRKAGQRVQEALDAGKRIDPRILGYAAERNSAYAAELIERGMDLQYSESQAMSYVLADRLRNGEAITDKELQTFAAQIERDSVDHYTSEQLATASQNIENAAPKMSYYATQFMRDAGLSMKDAQERCVVLNDLLRGETDIPYKDFQKLDMDSAVTRRVFTELTGIEIPEGIHKPKDLMPFYKRAPEGAAIKARQEAVANDRAVLETAYKQIQQTQNLRMAAYTALQQAAQERAEATAAQQRALEESKKRNLLERVFRTKEDVKNVKKSGVSDRASERQAGQPDNGSNQPTQGAEPAVARDGKVRATGKRVSAEELKLEGGSAIAISRTYTQSEYTDEMKSVEQENKKIGVKTVFLDNNLVLRAKNGDYIYARGVWDPETKTIYINANHSSKSVSEINGHEMFHAMKDDLGLSMEDARDQFVAEYGQETYDHVVDNYEKGIGSGLTDLEYFEEFLADANGRMQGVRGIDAAAYHDFAAGLLGQKNTAETAGGETKTSVDTDTEQRLDDLEAQRQELIDQLDFAAGSEAKDLNNRLAKVNYEIDRINAEERRAAVSTPIGNVLKNLDDYRRIDLISIGNQYSDGNWDGIESMTKPELVSELRDVLQNLADEDPGIRYYVRPVTSQNDNITRVRFSQETDPEVLDKLENEPTVTVYRAMQEIDGKLYPPMAAKIDDGSGKRKLVEPTTLGTWYRADEHPELVDKNGKFKLDKANGSTIDAAYNPYWHTSRSLLNDQFSSAHKRPNLVTVECEVPVSELTSGYRAEGAKDAVGEMYWHSGPVSSKLAKQGNPRRVILSRWVKVNRVVSDAEAARNIAQMLAGTDIDIPANTVTPSLRSALEAEGVRVTESGRVRFSTDTDMTNPMGADMMEEGLTSTDAKGWPVGYEGDQPLRYEEKFSVDTTVDAVNLRIEKEGDAFLLYDEDGNRVEKVTPEMVENSPLGWMLRQGAKGEDLDKQYAFFAQLIDSFQHTQDLDMIYAITSLGFQPFEAAQVRDYDRKKGVFGAYTSNSDPQYSTTVDFTTICLKTQQIVDVMSKTMMDLGRGLTEDEIVNIVYKATHEAGEPVPCPVCYVFSRWVGLGGLFSQIDRLQEKYRGMSREQVQARRDELLRRSMDILQQRKMANPDDAKAQKAKNPTAKDRAKVAEMIDARIDELYEQANVLRDKQLKHRISEKLPGLTEAEQAELDDLEADLEALDEWAWVNNVVLNKNYKPVPKNVLYNINAGTEFARDYSTVWKYRTTRGPAMGKATTPYAPAVLGQFVTGRSVATLNSKNENLRLAVEKNPFRKPEGNSDATKKLTAARKNAKAQNLIGGQRYQSTSDFRFEYALDYLLSFVDLQAIGSKVQLYTKVPEAVPFLASVGADVNCSLMPLGKGWGTDANGNKFLRFSSVTGMNEQEAFAFSAKYDNVQPIMVGLNRTHIELCLADDRITFVIPYHASGASEGRYYALMEAVGEKINKDGRTDYSNYQNDKRVANPTAAQNAAYNARLKILTGEGSKLTDAEKDAVRGSERLSNLYMRFYGETVDGEEAKILEKYLAPSDRADTTKDNNCFGVTFRKNTAEMIFPYEYWDMTTTFDRADENGLAFLDYCEELGVRPRFSGWSSQTGAYNEEFDFSKLPGYWKTLIDRKMYNNDGSYHEQRSIDVTDMDMTYVNRAESIAKLQDPASASKANDTSKTQAIVETVKERIAKRSPKTSIDTDLMDVLREQGADMKTFSSKAVKAAQKQVEKNAVLAGQMNQGAKDAAMLRRVRERYDSQVEKLEKKIETIQSAQKKLVSDAVLAERMNQGAKDAKLLRLERERSDAKIAELRGRIDQLRASKNRAMEELKQSFRQRTLEKRTATKERELRAKISRLRESFLKALQKPTDANYIPKSLVDGVVAVIDAIDSTSGRLNQLGEKTKATLKYENGRAAMLELKAQYDALKNHADPDLSSEFDEEFSSVIGELADRIGDTPLRDMDLDTLTEVYGVLRDIRAMLQDARMQIGTAEKIANRTAANEVMAQMSEAKGWKGLGKIQSKWAENTERQIERMSGYDENSRLWKMYEQIRDGSRKADKFIMDASKPFDALRKTRADQKQYASAQSRKIDSGLTDSTGKPVQMTRMQMMQLILSYEREQQNQNLTHLVTGAYILDNRYVRSGDFQKALDKAVFVPDITEQKISELEKRLTEWDHRYMDAARKLFTKVSSDAINDTTMILKHRPVANSPAYIPFTVHKDYVKSANEGIKFDKTLMGEGFLKDTVNNARQALVMEGLDQVINRHIGKVGLISGLAVPIRNFEKIWNIADNKTQTGVKQAVRDAWGNDGLGVIDRMLNDLQSSRESGRDLRGKIFDTVRSGFVLSTLASNISVTIKQASSYPTAGALISQQALAAGLRRYLAADKSKVFSEIDEHTGAHYKRRLGLSMQETGDMSKMDNAVSQFAGSLPGWLNPMKWIQNMDVQTTAALWEAAKAEIERLGTKKTDESYWQKVTDLYHEILEQTQPQYDVLHRPEIQKTTNKLVKSVIMFQTQPLQNAGILSRSLSAYNAEMKRARDEFNSSKRTQEDVVQMQRRRTSAKRMLARAISSQVMSSAVFTLMTLLARAINRKMNSYRDKDEELTARSISEAVMEDWAWNIVANAIPVIGNYLRDAESIIVQGKNYDLFQDATVEKMNDIASSIKNLADDPDLSDWEKATFELLSLAGIPATNVKNILSGITGHIRTLSKGGIESLDDYFSDGYNRSAKANYNRLAEALLSGDEERYQKVYEEIAEAGKDPSTVRTELRKRLKDVYETGDLDDRKAVDLLVSHDLADDEEEAKKLVYEWSLGSSVKEAYLAGALTADEATEALQAYGYVDDADDAYWKLQSWEGGDGYQKYAALSDAIKNGEDIQSVVDEYLDHGVTASTLSSQVTAAMKEEYLAADEATREDMRKNIMAAYEAMGYTPEQKEQTFFDWEWSDMKDRYEAGEIDREEVIQFLTENGKKNPEQTVLELDLGGTLNESARNGKLTEAEYTKYYLDTHEGKTDNDAFWAYQSATGGEGYKMYNRLADAVRSQKDLTETIRFYTDHGKDEEDLRSAITSAFKPEFIVATDKEREAMMSWLVTAYTALGLTEYKARKNILKWLDD